jgi:Zn-dependent protease
VSARQKLTWVVGAAVACGLAMPPFWLGVLRGAAVAVAFLALTVLREIGRLLAGTAMGLRPVIVELGEGESLLRFRLRGVLWDVRKQPFGSCTIFAPPATDAGLRARLAVLLLARPAVTVAVLLGLRALGVPLWGGVGDGALGGAGALPASLLGSVSTAAEALLLLGLVPFSITSGAVVPFESEGLQLIKLAFAKPGDLGLAFGRYYAATAFQALKEGDAARAVSACQAGLERLGPPWSDALRMLEAVALARTGDTTDARTRAEQDLSRQLGPSARALALNNWSWFTFVARDEAGLRLADRRSADALVLMPDLPAVRGTRGAVLLWQGRVAEALPLIEASRNGATEARSRDINTCLLALAYAAQGQSARAQAELALVKDPAATESQWAEAELRVKSSSEPAQIVRAACGHRALVVKGDGVELHDGGRVRRIASAEIDSIEVRLTARGRAQLSLRHAGRLWRLPLAQDDLAWTRMLIGGSVVVAPGGGPGAPAGSGPPPIAAQERAYAEHLAAQRMTVSTPKGILFLASAIAFAASMLIATSWQWLATIMPVLFIHELGHWLAMRAFGHRDARISFIPFLGAATFTKDPFTKPWQEVVMLLAGPVPGIVLGVALYLLPSLPHVDRTTVQSLAIMAIVINAGNLLPFHPLDGGRIVHALVTAGRPRLDLAFKSLATLAFVAAALALRDFVLGSIGLLGVIGWRATFRLARLEERIRRMPGFDPRLPAEQRRAFIFRTLAEEPSGQARQWGATVAALDMPLGYRRSPAWRVVAAAFLALSLVIGGSLVSRLVMARIRPMRCPTPESAVALSCDDGAPALAGIAWKQGPERALPPRSDIRDARGRLPLRAFVWCRADEDPDGRLVQIATELRQAAAGAPMCTALPWEELPPEAAPSTGARAKARTTFAGLRHFWYLSGDNGIRILDEELRDLPAPPDPEVVGLVRALVAAPPGSAARQRAQDALAVRLGRSPTESCQRVAIANVASGSPVDLENTEEMRSVHPSGLPPGEHWVRFAVGVASPADFAPAAAYLCKAGCRVQVLPTAPDDRRLSFCF